jgi:hypothetical protein
VYILAKAMDEPTHKHLHDLIPATGLTVVAEPENPAIE